MPDYPITLTGTLTITAAPAGNPSDPYPYPISQRTLTEREVTALCAIYWPIEEVGNAVAVCRLESSFDTGAHNQNGEDSRGLFQINVDAWPQYAKWNLWDALVNVYFAHKIWESRGSWADWYNSALKLGLI